MIKSPPAGSTPSMLRSITADEDYFERRNLRIACTQKSPSEDFLPQASEIIPRLYLADMYTATDPLTLQRLNITHVVSVVKEPWYTYPPHIHNLCVPVHDHPRANIGGYLDNAVGWIKGALEEEEGEGEGARVMVHCMWGMSRSPSVVIAYLMATKGMSLLRSMLHVKAKRRIVRPNRGFWHQLLWYEERLRRERERPVFTHYY